MHQRRSHAHGGKLETDPVECGKLIFSLWARIISRGGEVRHEAFQSRTGCGRDSFKDLRRTRERSQPPHTAVDLQMVRGADSARSAHSVPVADVFERVDDRREVVFEEGLSLRRKKI